MSEILFEESSSSYRKRTFYIIALIFIFFLPVFIIFAFLFNNPIAVILLCVIFFFTTLFPFISVHKLKISEDGIRTNGAGALKSKFILFSEMVNISVHHWPIVGGIVIETKKGRDIQLCILGPDHGKLDILLTGLSKKHGFEYKKTDK
jgi:hypothetical protein